MEKLVGDAVVIVRLVLVAMAILLCPKLTNMTPNTDPDPTHRNLQCGQTLLFFITI